VLDYFWTVTSPAAVAAVALRRRAGGGGGLREGDTKHLFFQAGETMIHDLENIGDAP